MFVFFLLFFFLEIQLGGGPPRGPIIEEEPKKKKNKQKQKRPFPPTGPYVAERYWLVYFFLLPLRGLQQRGAEKARTYSKASPLGLMA